MAWPKKKPAETDPSHSLINVIDNGRKNLTSQKNYVCFDGEILDYQPAKRTDICASCDFKRA